MVPPTTEKTPLLTEQEPEPSSDNPTASDSTSSAQRTADSEQAGAVTETTLSRKQSKKNHDSFRAIDWWRLLNFIYPYVIPNSTRLRLNMAFSFLFVFLGNLLQLIPPFALKLAVDILSSKTPSIAQTIPYIAMAAFYLGQISNSFVSMLGDVTYAFVSTNQISAYSVACFTKIHQLDVSYHAQKNTGETANFMIRGADSINQFIDLLVHTILPTLLQIILIFSIFMKLGTPLIGLSSFTAFVVYLVYTKFATDQRIKLKRDQNETREAVATKEVDSLTNYENIKFFGNEEYESKQYEKLQALLQKHSLRSQVSFRLLSFGQSFIRVTGMTLSLLFAARATANGALTPGGFVMVSQFLGQLYSPLTYIGFMYRRLVRSATDIEKSIELLGTEPKVQDDENASVMQMSEQDLLAKRKGSIAFKNVSFRYKSDKGRGGGVSNLSFHVKPGEKLGIVGSTGAGKSTLIRLIVRFYDPEEGQVLIDGENIRNFTQSSLREKFGVVPQDTNLFNNSLRYNIAFGKVDATDQEIFAAIEAAQLSELLEKHPEKLDTLVGERGIKLSGGERQRVAIARCILRKPLFVIFDEASSSLDSETEQKTQKALQQIIRGRTTVVVAHRLSTVMDSDCIIVLDDGKIIEQGTHDELLALSGKYKSLWSAQTNSTR